MFNIDDYSCSLFSANKFVSRARRVVMVYGPLLQWSRHLISQNRRTPRYVQIFISGKSHLTETTG